MKVIKNQKLLITETKQSSANRIPQAIHTGCVRLVRLITNNPAPRQMSYKWQYLQKNMRINQKLYFQA